MPSVFLPLPLVCKKSNNSAITTYMQENYAPLCGVSLFNQSYNLSTNNMKMFNPPMILILDHEEVWITIGTSNLDPITDFLRHQQIEIKRKPEVMQDIAIVHTFDQYFSTKCHEIFCLRCNQSYGFTFNLIAPKKTFTTTKHEGK